MAALAQRRTPHSTLLLHFTWYFHSSTLSAVLNMHAFISTVFPALVVHAAQTSAAAFNIAHKVQMSNRDLASTRKVGAFCMPAGLSDYCSRDYTSVVACHCSLTGNSNSRESKICQSGQAGQYKLYCSARMTMCVGTR